MAATNLAIVGEHQITVYSDALHTAGTVLARIPLGSSLRADNVVADLLRANGWKINGAWGWTSTPDGVLRSVAVRSA